MAEVYFGDVTLSTSLQYPTLMSNKTNIEKKHLTHLKATVCVQMRSKCITEKQYSLKGQQCTRQKKNKNTINKINKQ